MVDDTLLLDSGSMVPIVCLILRLETSRIPCMSTQLFDTRLIGLKVPDLAQSVIRSESQPYEGN